MPVKTLQAYYRYPESRLALAASFVVSFLISYLLARALISPDFFLDRVRQVGVLGPAILQGHSNIADTARFALISVLTVLMSLVLWWAWAEIRMRGRTGRHLGDPSAMQEEEEEKKEPGVLANTPQWWIAFVGVPIIIGVVTWAPELFWRGDNYWYFAFEQSEHLAWTNEILRGALVYKDLLVPYGPLMEYPLALLSWLLGPSVLTLRIYIYVLNTAAYLIFYFVALAYFRRTSLAALAALFFLAFDFSLFPGMNGSPSRLVFGLLPFLLLDRYIIKSHRVWLVGSGLGAGAALLFSPEYGTVAVLVSAFVLILYVVTHRVPYQQAVLSGVAFASGILLAFVPFALYHGARGALSSLFSELWAYGGYRALGVDALAANIDLIAAAQSFELTNFLQVLRVYLPPLIYLVVLVEIGTALTARRLTRVELWSGGLAAFGLASFPIVIQGSTSVGPLLANSTIGALLAIRYLVRVVAGFGDLGRRASPVVLSWSVLLGLSFLTIVVSLADFLAIAPPARQLVAINVGKLNPAKFGGRWLPIGPTPAEAAAQGLARLGVPRAEGIYVSTEWRDETVNVVRYITAVTKPEEPIFVFPIAPMYYFLADRRVTTRFVHSHLAVSSDYRAELLRDLERQRPRYILREHRVGGNVPPEVQNPDLLRYVREHYTVEAVIGRIDVMRRRGS